jgi:hypothetical protein
MAKIITFILSLFLLVFLNSLGFHVNSVTLPSPDIGAENDSTYTEESDSVYAEFVQVPTLKPREQLRLIYTSYIGVGETGGKGRGTEVERFLKSTNLGSGHDWCAAFAKTCFDEAGIKTPKANAWSPSWFSKNKLTDQPRQGDVFSTWNIRAGRISHVGFVDEINKNHVTTVEGNVKNGNQFSGVHRLFRNPKQIHSYANWIDD